jgi:hypothetical protein
MEVVNVFLETVYLWYNNNNNDNIYYCTKVYTTTAVFRKSEFATTLFHEEIIKTLLYSGCWYLSIYLLRGSAATIASTRGVRQGDPCSPLFFALALQGPLEELRELDLARPLAYADDIFLQGTQGEVEVAFPVVCAVLEPLGLQVRLPKCAAYSAAEANGAAVSEALGI